MCAVVAAAVENYLVQELSKKKIWSLILHSADEHLMIQFVLLSFLFFLVKSAMNLFMQISFHISRFFSFNNKNYCLQFFYRMRFRIKKFIARFKNFFLRMIFNNKLFKFFLRIFSLKTTHTNPKF